MNGICLHKFIVCLFWLRFEIVFVMHSRLKFGLNKPLKFDRIGLSKFFFRCLNYKQHASRFIHSRTVVGEMFLHPLEARGSYAFTETHTAIQSRKNKFAKSDYGLES